jgi:hypothetical protein
VVLVVLLQVDSFSVYAAPVVTLRRNKAERYKPDNLRLQRTWPAFSSSIVEAVTGMAFSSVVLLPNAGHAAEAQCYATLNP